MKRNVFDLTCISLLAVSEQEPMWANGEDNPNFFTLFGKFAELQWIYNDAAKCMANKVGINFFENVNCNLVWHLIIM